MIPNSHFLSSICSIPSWRVFQNLTPCWLSSDSDSDKTGGGSLGSCSRLGSFRREKGREECVWCTHGGWEQYFCSRVDGLVPAAFRRILFMRPWCLFDFCPCLRKSPLSQDGSSLWGTCVHAKSMYWSEACTLPRQGTRLAPAQFIAEQKPFTKLNTTLCSIFWKVIKITNATHDVFSA